MNNYKFFQNNKCEYFPCHKGVNEEDFNCLFCYCPLYALKENCGGNFKYTNGIKDCSGCTKPHGEGSYDFIMSKIGMIIDLGKKD
ncbi:MAG: cysteine-rich small domain-containing protein [Firmicutes bacterium]|jgi:Zn-finger protein|nr:cysteine-rich small domain-containing protein [Bacillota bacterium]